MSQPMDPQAYEQLAAANAKLDVLVSQHATTVAQVADHESRIRKMEADQVRTEGRVDDLTARDADQEGRLRAADKWRYAVPITAIGALIAGAAAITSAVITALGK